MKHPVRSPIRIFLAMVACAGLCASLSASAEPRALGSAIPSQQADEFAPGGIATCIDCHDETEEYPVLSILKTRHAVSADLRTPLASAQGCQTCHGAGAAHVEDADEPLGRQFRADAPAAQKNEACLQCHQGGARMNWAGSTHESENVACVSCHTIHIGEDPVLTESSKPDLWARRSQPGVCFGCHKQQRAESHRLSSHPTRDGKIGCSSCHNPHGSIGPKLLAKPTLNETCYQCHAEKRGPFLWEHSPVREDCSNCHTPHGSNHRPLLKARAPYLCQQCHMAGYHPSDPYTSVGIVGNGGAQNKLLSKSCANCHIEVHGSNHPSGVRWTR